MINRRRFLWSAAAGVASIRMARAAQPFAGGRPVTIIVPFAPGGGSDVIARILSFPLADALKVPVIVENRPGAGGVVAARYVKAATADGTTLFMVDMGFSAGATLDRNARYHPLKDFTAVASLGSVSSILTVKEGSPYHSLKELVAAGQRQAGAITMASGGVGGSAHLIGAMFASQAGFQPTHIPYRGMAPAMTDVLSGQADFIVATAPVALPYIRNDGITAFAVTSTARINALPNVATFAEQGYPGVIADDVYGIVAPKGLSAELTAVLYQEITAIVRGDAFAARLAPLATTALPMDSPQAYAAFLESDFAKWRDVIQQNHIAQ
ncbi:MAG TPA: tripartite tricarboxylate transporter substrate binding protein [Pseudolabrys sp.]|nr:tripartite tricarboxylate transporter substrate binding protein [Pseudolabrys sp.]